MSFRVMNYMGDDCIPLDCMMQNKRLNLQPVIAIRQLAVSMIIEFAAIDTLCFADATFTGRTIDAYELLNLASQAYIEAANYAQFKFINMIVNHVSQYIANDIIRPLLSNQTYPFEYLNDVVIRMNNASMTECLTGLRHDLLEQEADRRYKNYKARSIQRRFRICISNPYHPMCQRRLMHEFVELQA